MKKLIAITPAILTVALCTTGCATKSRSFDAKGMYVSETGQLAVGYIHVDAIPEGTESAVVHYEEDTALLSPSTKTHAIDIILTGTNSVASSEGIIEAICDAFVAVAPSVPKASAAATSPLDPAKANADNATAAVIAFPQSLDGKLADGKLTEDEAEDEGGGEEDNLGPGGISKPLH